MDRPARRRGSRRLLSPQARKAWLLAHVVLSVGWLGAGTANAALGLHALTTDGLSGLTPLQAHQAIHLIDLWAVIPAAFGALITGIVVSVWTRWGLFIHWWVIAKLVLTIVVITVSTIGIGRWIEISTTSGMDATARSVSPAILIAATGNLVAFLTMTWLSIYKPRGQRRAAALRRAGR